MHWGLRRNIVGSLGIILASVMQQTAFGDDATISTESLPLATEMEEYTFQLAATHAESYAVWGVEEVFWSNYPLPVRTHNVDSIHGFAVIMNNGSISQTLRSSRDPLPPQETNCTSISLTSHLPSKGLALKTDGTLMAWANSFNPDFNLIDMPTDLNPIVAIASGAEHHLALERHGIVRAWGMNDHGQCIVHKDLNQVVKISAGGNRSLALRKDGTVVSWGELLPDNQIPPGLSNVVDIASGESHDLALKADGTVVAWGDNSNGQCDTVNGASNIVSIAAWNSYSAALTAGGKVIHDLVSDNDTNIPDSVDIAADGGAFMAKYAPLNLLPEGMSISADGLIAGKPTKAGAYEISVVLQHNEDPYYRYASKTLELTVLPSKDLAPEIDHFSPYSSAVAIAEGTTASFSLRAHDPEGNGLVFQWTLDGINVGNSTTSFNYTAEFGDFNAHKLRCYVSEGIWQEAIFQEWDISIANTPMEILNNALPSGIERLPYFAQLEATNGIAPYSWEVAPQVQTWGDVDRWVTTLPEPNDLNHIQAIDTGYGQYLALMDDGTVRNWGRDLGAMPEGLTNVVAIAADCWQNLALHADGTVTVWGTWWDPAVTPTGFPVNAYSTNIIAVAGGANFSLALLADGTVYQWGPQGEEPTYDGLNDATAIAAGRFFAVALRSNGTVVAWGDNTHGQCDVPADLTDVVAITAGDTFVLALKSDGTVAAWGEYRTGNNQLSSLEPMYIPEDLDNVVAISAGFCLSVARKADGSIVRWGNLIMYPESADIPENLGPVTDIAAGYGCIALKKRSTQLPSGLELSEDGIISGTAMEAVSNQVTFIARDAQGELAYKELNLDSLTHPNARPVIYASSPLAGHTFQAINSEKNYAVYAFDEGNTPAYRWTLDGIIISDEASFNYCPQAEDLGSHILQCYVSDGFWIDEVFTEWIVQVEEYPRPVIVTDTLPVCIERDWYSTQIEVTGGLPPYSYSITTLPSGLSMCSGGAIIGEAHEPGSQMLTFTVEDAHGMSQTKDLLLTVLPHSNQLPPVIRSISPQSFSSIGEELSQIFFVEAYDPEGAPLRYRWSWNGKSIDSSTNSCTRTTRLGDAGSYQLSCFISDNYWPEIEVQWHVTVLNDNDGDGVLNIDERAAGTDPMDPVSLFVIEETIMQPDHTISIRFQSVPGQHYYVRYSDDLKYWRYEDSILATETQTTWTSYSLYGSRRFYRITITP